MKKLSTIDMVALILLIIGGLNWGLVAFDWNAVDSIFGAKSMLSTIIYGLVGLSALYVAWLYMKLEKK